MSDIECAICGKADEIPDSGHAPDGWHLVEDGFVEMPDGRKMKVFTSVCCARCKAAFLRWEEAADA